jgi:hypothetical protein
MRNFTDWLDAYYEYTEETESAPILHKWVSMSAVSAVLQRKIWLKVGRLRIYPNMYVVLVAEPGVARKTQAINYAVPIIREISGVRLSADAITKEALTQDIAEARDASILPNGDVMEHCSLSIISKEFESFLGQKKENTKMLVLLTDLFDAPDKWDYRTKHSGQDATVAVCINLLAATTPDSIASSLPTQAIGGGLTSRIMFVWASGKTKKVTAPPEPDPKLKLAIIQDLAAISRLSGEYTMSKDCFRQWDAWYTAYDEVAPHRIAPDKCFRGWYSRKPLYIQKLALIHTAVTTDSNVVEWPAFETAIADIEEVEIHMGRTFSAVGRSEVSPDVDAVMREIQSRGVIAEKKLLQLVWRDIDAKKFDNVIETILRTGKVVRKFQGPEGARGIWYYWAEGV